MNLCANKRDGCNRTKDINPSSKLCIVCHNVTERTRSELRNDNSERQSKAREEMINARRSISDTDDTTVDNDGNIPPIDVESIHRKYSSLAKGDEEADQSVLVDILESY